MDKLDEDKVYDEKKDIEEKTHQVILQLQIHNNKTPERKIVIIIDTREQNKFRYNLLEKCLKEMFPNETRLVRQKLESGDITFTDMSVDDIKNGKYKQEDNKFPLIELKTVDDLIKTIGSQRDEQTDTMKQFTDRRFYLIEGCMEAATSQHMIKAAYGRLNTLWIRDGFGLCKTDGQKQSVIFLLNMFISLQFMEEKRFTSENKGKFIFVESGKATKNPFVSILTTVSGVSQRIAESIVEVYPTLPDYINDHINLLSTSRSVDSVELYLNERVKEVNKSISKKIYSLFGPKSILDNFTNKTTNTTTNTPISNNNNNNKVTNKKRKKRIVEEEEEEEEED